MKNKSDYRLYAKELRKTLDIKALSNILVQKIRESSNYKSAKNVMIFYPTKYEVDLRDLLTDDKNFYLPKVKGEELLVCPYSEKLEKSVYNIMEPCTNPVDIETLDLVVVPALMADKNGYRLGYGGGFYDRFLKSCSAKTMTCLSKELVVDSLPFDNFDVKIDEIICM